MVEIKVGQEFPVTNAVKGKSNKGEYFKADVKADRGYDKIQVWATNPAEAMNITGMAKVAEIHSTKLSAHQYNGKWYPDYTVNAKLVQGATEVPDFMDAIPVDDTDLPF